MADDDELDDDELLEELLDELDEEELDDEEEDELLELELLEEEEDELEEDGHGSHVNVTVAVPPNPPISVGSPAQSPESIPLSTVNESPGEIDATSNVPLK